MNSQVLLTPTTECEIWNCENSTNIALLFLEQAEGKQQDHEMEQVYISLCPSHAYPHEPENITRFVVSHYNGTGTAKVIETIPLASISTYTPEDESEENEDKAWCVLYTGLDGIKCRVFVIWYSDSFHFELIEEAERNQQ